MQNVIITALLFGLILILPIQYVHAEGWNWESLPDVPPSFESLSKSFEFETFLSPDELLQNISSGNFDESEINDGYIVIRDASDEFYFSLEDNFERFTNSNNAIKLKQEQIVQQFETFEEIDKKELTEELQKISYSSLRIYISYQNIHGCDNVTPDIELSEFLDSFPTYDEYSQTMTLRQQMDSIKEIEGMDDLCYGYEEMLKLYQDSEYLFQIPLLPDSEGNLVSIYAYCTDEMDKESCNKIRHIGIFTQMIAKKDPNAAREGGLLILLIVKDINNQTDSIYDSEIEVAEKLLNLTYYDLIEIEFFELSNGEIKSLNQISAINCYDEFYPIESTIEYLDSDKSKLDLIQKDLDWIRSNADAIQNNQCSIYLLQ